MLTARSRCLYLCNSKGFPLYNLFFSGIFILRKYLFSSLHLTETEVFIIYIEVEADIEVGIHYTINPAVLTVFGVKIKK